MAIPDFEGGPFNWVLAECDQCGRKNESGEAFPDDWCVICLTLHPAMRVKGAARLRGATLCPDCNPYRLGPDGEPVN